MKIVIAPDSFKGSLTAKQAAESIHTGLLQALPQADYELIPMADGGEGTVQSLVDAKGGIFQNVDVLNPFGETVSARYGLIDHGKTAVIEMSAASGIQFIRENQTDPLAASSYGTGQLMLDAMHRGARQLIIGIGGSATTDGGQGMAAALGVRFLNKQNQEIHLGGGGLGELDHIDVRQIDPLVSATHIRIASDVTNPLVGPNGSAFVFGPQKGANPQMVHLLDKNLRHYAAVVQRDLGKDLAAYPGAGAAGGLGVGLLAFTNASMAKGIGIVIETTDFKKRVKNADLVITGEGSIDFQTQYGKTPIGVAQAAKAVSPQATIIALAGHVGQGINPLYKLGIDAVFSILPGVQTLPEAIEKAASNLSRTAENIGRLIAKTIPPKGL
ncbi:MAG: glycerate kinase [Oenococcus sp.]|uniref:glycerate kinase family protein n=1 Tax=Oenococcus sp. TaxID=1979414 RepID=UPI0039ED9AFB